MLLIDFLENAAEYLKEHTQKRRKLEAQYRKIYDRDIKREISIIAGEIKKKKSEVTNEILLNLDEFRYLNKYFPELLSTFMEDEFIGPILKKKRWLLDYKPLPPQEAAMRLQEIKAMRTQLHDAKKFLNKWVGAVDARSFGATFPALKGRFKGKLDKEEVIQIIDEADKELRHSGWLFLITDSLIKIPLAKFTNRLLKLQYEEMAARMDLGKSKGKGTVAEANALRKYEKVRRNRIHYENVIIQLLLANPAYSRSLKKRNWLSREKKSVLEKIAQRVTPHKVKERTWLNQMNKKLSIDEEKD